MSNPLNILLIDDNPDDRALVMRELQREFPGLQVEQITEAQGFAHALEGSDFELVITDYQLRWTDGLAILRAVKAGRPDCPVVMFTATGSEEVAVEAMKDGLDDYVLKSSKHLVRLSAAVRSALKRVEDCRAAREAEARYRQLFDGVPVGLYRTTPAGEILEANLGLMEMLGYLDREALLEVNADDLYENPEDRQQWQILMKRDLVVRGFQVLVRRRDGETIWVVDNARAVVGAKDQVLYYEGSLKDISARKRAEGEQRQLEEQVRQSQKMEAVGRLAAGVAHDFNNLLTVIIGLSELALKKPSVEDSLRGDLEVIRNAGAKAAELTHQLLAFSRQQVLLSRVLDLNSIVAEFVNLLRRTLEEHIEIRTVLDPALGRVKADPGQIHQVLLNLAVNARDAMPTGGRLTIETKNLELDEKYAGHPVAVKPGSYVELAVSDNGSGMDEETRTKIFEPFFTTKVIGEGTGLGLATVYGIVKQSGGYIWVDSEPGEGTTFKVHLRRIDVEAQTENGADAPADPRGGSETILVVEDNDLVRNFSVRILEEKGYQVLSAQGPEEALALSKKHGSRIGLLVTDVVLPGGSGVAVADRIVEMHPETKTLYISGYAPEGIGHDGQLEAHMEFLGKPFSASDLALKVREILDKGTV